MDLEPWDPLDHPARIEVRRQESDDSDAEGGLGNVTRVVLRPPGHSGKAKRGHLCFDASYEGGNLGRVDFISEYEYDLFIRPDTANPRFRLWFNFVVDNVRADQRVIFNVVNLCKIKTLFRDGMTPLVKTSSRPKWQRLPGKYVYYHKSPEHRNHYILSFAFAFDREEDVYQFAFSFPYSYSRAQAHLDLLLQRDYPFFQRDTIGNSLQNRKLDVITISNVVSGNNTGGPPLVGGKRPKVVVVLARIHPGETPSSYVAQGLMDFLVSSHPLAGVLRDHVVFKIVPMLNPDGVFLGNLRSTLMGYDLNRHWNQVSPWSHPTLHAIRNHLIDLDASKTLELDMVIDIHAHSSLMGAFIYGNAYDDVYRFERHILFPKLLAHNAEDYNPSNTMYNRDPNKAATARRHLCEILRNTVNAYTLEVSFFGYNQPLSNSIITYNEDGYLRLGRNLARTFFDYYKATGIIPGGVSGSAGPQGSLGDEGERKMSRGASKPPLRPPPVRRKRSRDKSATKSPVRAEEPLHEMNEETGTAVVKLSQLTREVEKTSVDEEERSSDEDDEEDGVPLKATRNGVVVHSQFIPRRRKSRSSSRGGGGSERKESLPNLRHSGEEKSSAPPGSSSKKVTPSYKTFDFSGLRRDVMGGGRGFEGGRRVGRSGVASGPKKVGGGGVVARRKGHAVKKDLGGVTSDTETESPCLTIIDFNLLIRKGLDGGRVSRSRGWSSSKKKAVRRSRAVAKVVEGGYSGQEESCEGGGVSEGEGQRRKKVGVRRRRALALRGAMTEGWEDGYSSSGSSNSGFETSNLLPQQTVPKESLERFPPFRRLRSNGRTESPSTLCPSPIFLPQ